MTDKKIDVEGKVALVSGSSRGIGKAITIELLENGVKKVYAGARDVSTLDELKEKYGERLVPVELDVTKDETIENVSNQAPNQKDKQAFDLLEQNFFHALNDDLNTAGAIGYLFDLSKLINATNSGVGLLVKLTQLIGIINFHDREDIPEEILELVQKRKEAKENKDFEAADSFQDMTFIKSIVDFANSEVEDEYAFIASQAEEDFKVKLNLNREDLSLTVEAKRLGVVLSDT